jgi:hypothetical protein
LFVQNFPDDPGNVIGDRTGRAVVRTHGPASDDPNVLERQLTMFNGGCEDVATQDLCVDIQVGVFPSPEAA